MNKDSIVRARMETRLKENVQEILNNLGLSTTEAITIFFKQIELHNGLPFEVKIPNKETQKAIEDTRKGIDVIECKDADDLFKSLEI